MKKLRMPLETRRPVTPKQIFPPRRNYTSLSMKDLLDARDAYHVYLSTLDNVVATAVGRYLIHERDWYATHPPNEPRPDNFPLVKEARSLTNSVMRPWSWPAVLVFVRDWQSMEQLGDQAVPRTLYLPDGRVIPTCVVQTTADRQPLPSPGPARSSALLGGSYSCLREHQGEYSIGTISCLVRKGGTYYALTNRHVAGGDGETVSAFYGGEYHPIGTTSNIAADRLAMPAAFSDWGNSRLYLTLDAGLIRITNVGDWTSQVFGIGEIGEVFDATEQSITTDLIGCPVRAFGGSSGVAEGEIRALFYRYESLGGYEYATDVLIGPRRSDNEAVTAHPLTSPGDSATLWFYDPPSSAKQDPANADFDTGDAPPARGPRARILRPIAMQWGGMRLAEPDGTETSFALGTFLSTVCRTLDVEIVRDWSTGHDEYWGKIGHFAIGWKACDKVTGALGQLMQKNQVRIGFGDDKLGQGSEFRMGRNAYVPLVDVPDYVLVQDRKNHPNEGEQHFADVDIYDINGGTPLLDRCVSNAKNISAKVWKDYFDGFAGKGVGPDEGALPFRVWQIWEAMVEYLKKKDVMRFVAAAGIMGHYLGDASQPLHCSYMHHGIPPMIKVGTRSYPVRHGTKEFQAFAKTKAYKIHGLYEENMLEVDAPAALAEINQKLSKGSYKGPKISSGHDAAKATIQLMAEAQGRLKPKTIIAADDPTQSLPKRAQTLWSNKKIRDATTTSLAESVRYLAAAWQAAWKAGGGDNIAKAKLVQFTETQLANVYRKEKNFIPSMTLADMVKSGDFEP